MPSSPLDEILLRIRGLEPGARDELERDVVAGTAEFARFVPNPGPQTDAFNSPADLLLYGGEAGGGKSSLLLGLAFAAHSRSLIMRRQYTDLSALTEEAVRLNGTRAGFNGASPPKLRTRDNRLVEFGAAKTLGDEQNWKGRAHDFLGLDEAVDFLEVQVRFLMGWVRSADENQRTRTVLATNPPTSASGDWIVPMFRPWLDVTHANPAEPGDLRWFITDERGQDAEVDGPEPIARGMQTFIPKSRTFIPASLADNPYLINTGYRAELDALPEPYRSAYRDGNFMAARADDERQVIPTEWVVAAQARWTPAPPKGTPQSAMAMDVAEAQDLNVLAWRHDGWYAPLVSVPGNKAADGSTKAALIVKHRRDNATLIIDVGGGYAGGLIERLKDNTIPHVAFNAASASHKRTRDGKLGFVNKRAEAWWKFREALDPDQEGGSAIALPDDGALVAELTAPTFEVGRRGIQVESKKEIRKRLGRSTDRADPVVMAWSEGQSALERGVRRRGHAHPKVTHGFTHMKKRRRQ